MVFPTHLLMAPHVSFFLLVLVLLAASVQRQTVSASSIIGSEWGLALLEAPKTCNSDVDLVGDCIEEDDEMDMGSEVDRRILRRRRRRRYISYGALRKNRVPCNRRGHSYYNCARGRRANPYRRGCSIITRCARVIR